MLSLLDGPPVDLMTQIGPQLQLTPKLKLAGAEALPGGQHCGDTVDIQLTLLQELTLNSILEMLTLLEL